jgi:hypothetical protein
MPEGATMLKIIKNIEIRHGSLIIFDSLTFLLYLEIDAISIKTCTCELNLIPNPAQASK